MNEKLLNKIIRVAYSDASIWERISIHILAQKDKEIKSLFSKHAQIADRAHGLRLDDLPDEILQNVHKISKVNSGKEKSLFFDLYSFIFRRPAISAAILSMIILSLISTFIFKRPEIHQQYSQREIELADRQVKHSLALIASVFEKTTSTVEKDILTDRVSKPIKESLNLVNEYLEEDKNENTN